MLKKFKFTNERIRSLPPNPSNAASTDLEVSDTELTGLKCLSGKTGNKRFLFRYVFQSRKRSITLGRFPEIDVATARKAAKVHRAVLAEGKDPKAVLDARSSIPTVSQFFWDTYVPLQKKHKKTWQKDCQRFRDFLEPTIGHLPYPSLTARHLQQIQIELSTDNADGLAYANATVNRVIAVIKTVGQFAVRLGVVDINEANKIKQLKEDNVRERFLDADELRALITVARQWRNKSVGGLIAMLAITGTRWSEMRLAERIHLDTDSKTLFIPDTKNGRSRTVHLSDLALDIIKDVPTSEGNPYLFPGRKRGKPISDARKSFRLMLAKAGIDPTNIVIHTLRHSVASNLVSAGATLNDVKAQLAHVDIASTQRYAKLTTERMRQTSDLMTRLVS